jgi:hypothetical protein
LAFSKLDINLDENFDENDEMSVSNRSFESSSSVSKTKKQGNAPQKRGGGREPSFDGEPSLDPEEEGDFDDEPPPDDDEVRE